MPLHFPVLWVSVGNCMLKNIELYIYYRVRTKPFHSHGKIYRHYNAGCYLNLFDDSAIVVLHASCSLTIDKQPF